MTPAASRQLPLLRGPSRRFPAVLTAVAMLGASLAGVAGTVTAAPSAAEPAAPRLVGSLQTELGCAEDWAPACDAGALSPTATDGLFSTTVTLPGGDYELKVLAGTTWDDPSWGRAGATGADAANIRLHTAGEAELEVFFDTETGRTSFVPTADVPEPTEADAPAPVRQPGGDEQFYFVLTDRFANGDTANDTGYVTVDGVPATDRLEHGFDPTDKGFYHGGDIAGLRQNLDYIEGLGTTAIWLTPSFENRPVQGTGADASAGYHGYWITDFLSIDPHLGTNEELDGLIAEAHARDIKVYFDIITNHTADIIDYEEGEYTYRPTTTEPYTPFVPIGLEDVKNPAWLNDPAFYNNRGNSTWAGESVILGDFDGLDDLDTSQQAVVDGFVDIYQHWADAGIDGFRIDTVKHVDFSFWEQWTTAIKEATDNPEFFMFGEVYDADPTKLSPYVRDTDMDSVLDFTYQSAAAAFADGSGPRVLQRLFDGDAYYTTPTKNAHALPTFLGNHDMGRLGYVVKGREDALQRSELAHSLMYLTRGQPVVYYGDEQGFVGSVGDGKDKNSRQSLFDSQVAEFRDQALLDGSSGAGDHYGTDGALYTHIAGLAALRSAHPALSDGAQVEQHVAAGAGVYAFSRVDTAADAPAEYLVAVNNATTESTVELTALTPDATFAPLYGTDATATSGADGTVAVTVPALGAVVLQAQSPLTADADPVAPTFSTPVLGQGLEGLQEIAVDLGTERYAETTISSRVVGASEWELLGTIDDGAPRLFQDVADVPPGTVMEYRAVVRDADDRLTQTVVSASVGDDHGTGAPLPTDGPPPLRDVTVSVAGTMNPAMGCSAAWMPACDDAVLSERAGSVFSGTWTLPAGDYEYKVAIDQAWTESYGRDGENVTFTLPAEQEVTFVYDDLTHRVAHFFEGSPDGRLAVAAGSFQTHLGCAGDWDPTCLGSWMAPDGDDTYTLTTNRIPAGLYETKTAFGRGWDGALPAQNLGFEVPVDWATMVFTLDATTGEMTVAADQSVPGDGDRAFWLDARTLALPAAAVPDGGDPAARTWTLHGAPTGGITVADGVVTTPGGSDLPLTLLPDGVPEDLQARHPLVDGYLAVSLDEAVTDEQVAELLTGELRLTQSGPTGLEYSTGVQVAGVVDDLFTVASDVTLGATWDGDVPTLALWAPTARSVTTRVWLDGDGVAAGNPTDVPAERQADGTWVTQGAAGWKDAAYVYDVEVYVHSTGAVEHNVVTDPASVALTLNSEQSVLVDLSDPAYMPSVWADTPAPVVERDVDRSIYELHVRDFSISDESVPEAERGTYMAFTRESDGMKHLRTLAAAGLNTVHLLPTFDIATIEEDRALQDTTDDLSGFAPDSTEQQAAVAAVADTDAFNWGYDPLHFTAPEGSYATEGNQDGGARVAEFRSMVGGLHASDLQVVLDQVFNHTAASGQSANSVLDRVVPGYYQRLSATGEVETSTCCENVATENAMAERLMVDSVVTWARDYKVDGFRFDLMGHHSRDTMLAVRAGLDALTLEKDGVDGSAVYLYGEGWNFGEVADNALFEQATQGQLGGTGIGTFSDRLRDAVHGGSPVSGESIFQQGFGTGLGTDPNGRPTSTADPSVVNDGSAEEYASLAHSADLVRLGLAGNLRDLTFETSTGTVQRGDEIDYNGQPAGYADSPEEVVTYVDAHDNETLFDILTLKLPVETSMADRVRMNTLSLATATLSQTPSFWHAGTDLLRSKSLDRDSYNSGDHFNRVDWTGQESTFGSGLPPEEKNGDKWDYMRPLLADPALKPGPDDMAAAHAAATELLALRYSTPLFRLGEASLITEKVTFPGSGADATPGVIVMHVDDTVGEDVDPALDGMLVVFNASPDAVTETLDGLVGRDLALSTVQAEGADAVVRETAWDAASGQVTVPARTVAVLTEAQVGGPTEPTEPPTEEPTVPPTEEPTVSPTDEPTEQPTDGAGDAVVTLSAGTVRAGENLTVDASGFAPGETVQVWLNSEPQLLVARAAGDDGALSVQVTVPLSTAPGDHTVRAVGLASGIDGSAALTVLAADGSGADGDGASGPVGQLSLTGAAPLLAAALALLLLAAGVATVVARRRRDGVG